MTIDKADIDRLVRQMEELTMEAHVVWQAVDEARTEIVHELRNLIDQKPVERPETSEAIPESISCTECDIDSPNSLAEALREGWTELRYDPSGSMWNFLGCCPGCSKNESAEAVVKEWAKGPKTEGTLF